jgi:hypothetical protein
VPQPHRAEQRRVVGRLDQRGGEHLPHVGQRLPGQIEQHQPGPHPVPGR